MQRLIIGGITGVIAISAIIIVLYTHQEREDFEAAVSQYFSRDSGWTLVQSTSVFQTYVRESDIKTEGGRQVYDRVILELNPAVNYDELKADGNTVIVYPTFTASAYTEPGFYTFYRGECDTKCLTIQIQNNFAQPQANPNALQVFRLLGYPIITDVDVDKDPSILTHYNKITICEKKEKQITFR
jgi:hypothetical protein